MVHSLFIDHFYLVKMIFLWNRRKCFPQQIFSKLILRTVDNILLFFPLYRRPRTFSKCYFASLCAAVLVCKIVPSDVHFSSFLPLSHEARLYSAPTEFSRREGCSVCNLCECFRKGTKGHCKRANCGIRNGSRIYKVWWTLGVNANDGRASSLLPLIFLSIISEIFTSHIILIFHINISVYQYARKVHFFVFYASLFTNHFWCVLCEHDRKMYAELYKYCCVFNPRSCL